MTKRKPDSYRFIEHKADIGIKLEAGSFRSVFPLLLKAVNSLAFSVIPDRSEKQSLKLFLEYYDREELLVDFSNELLYQIYDKYLCPIGLTDLKLEDNTMKSLLLLSRVQEKDYKTEIKSATYHDLEIKVSPEKTECLIYFDL